MNKQSLIALLKVIFFTFSIFIKQIEILKKMEVICMCMYMRKRYSLNCICFKQCKYLQNKTDTKTAPIILSAPCAWEISIVTKW